MFPSFPHYKEGTGGRGQIEPGPPVITQHYFKFICYRNTSCNNIRNISSFKHGAQRHGNGSLVYPKGYVLALYMTDQLERKKATRRGNRAVITKYSNEAKELLANGENIDENTNDRLNTLHDLLEEKLCTYQC